MDFNPLTTFHRYTGDTFIFTHIVALMYAFNQPLRYVQDETEGHLF